MRKPLVVIRGGGDIATGTCNRLFHAGFKVVVLEIGKPTVIRRAVSAASAVFDGECQVEAVNYIHVKSVQAIDEILQEGNVPVLVDPNMDSMIALTPDLLVDATLAKKNMGLSKDLAPYVIALGPGFFAGQDCHAVIETSRGHDLGRIIYRGAGKANTGIPGNIEGYTEERIIRSPGAGYVAHSCGIGDLVEKGQCIGQVNNIDIYAEISGVIRGFIHPKVEVFENMKIGDIDPRANVEACYSISDKARALGGSVLEAYLNLSGGLRIED